MAFGNAGLALCDDPDQDRIVADLTTFFGPRADRFLPLYEKMRARPLKKRGGVMSWNWAALFFPFVWFFYRKQYLMGALVVLIPIVMGFVVGGAGAGATAVFAMMANGLYVTTALGRIAKADTLGLAGEARADYLRRAGGVSTVSGLIALVLTVTMTALVLAALKH